MGSCTRRGGFGQMHIERQLILLWSAASCCALTSFLSFAAGVGTCVQPAFRGLEMV